MASSGSSSGFNIAYKTALSSGSDATPSFSTSTAATVEFSILLEFSGLETSPALLFQAFKSSADGATSPDTETCSATDTEAPCLWLAGGRTRLSMTGTHTSTLASNNVTTVNAITNNDGTSTLIHYRFAWGETTSNASATNVTQTSDSMNISGLTETLATFNMAAAAAGSPAFPYVGGGYYPT